MLKPCLPIADGDRLGEDWLARGFNRSTQDGYLSALSLANVDGGYRAQRGVALINSAFDGQFRCLAILFIVRVQSLHWVPL